MLDGHVGHEQVAHDGENGVTDSVLSHAATQRPSRACSGSAPCKMLEFSGITVGLAFVGAVAGALAMADPVRALHEGEEFSVVDLDLRSPDRIQLARNTKPGDRMPLALPAA